MSRAQVERLMTICAEALVKSDDAVDAVIEAVKDEPTYREYFAVVAAVVPRTVVRLLLAWLQNPLAGATVWMLGVGVVLDAMKRRKSGLL
jgi:hypothetical protein